MFKVLVLRELYALSDEQVEYQIADRLSIQRFLGIDLAQEAPDYTAIWRRSRKAGRTDDATMPPRDRAAASPAARMRCPAFPTQRGRPLRLRHQRHAHGIKIGEPEHVLRGFWRGA